MSDSVLVLVSENATETILLPQSWHLFRGGQSNKQIHRKNRNNDVKGRRRASECVRTRASAQCGVQVRSFRECLPEVFPEQGFAGGGGAAALVFAGRASGRGSS